MIQEFVCPNGRMSVNGVCPIFEGDDGQIKDIKKTSTFDAEKEDEFIKDRLEFDFEKPTPSFFESAGNIIQTNINAYNSFVEEKLGMSPIASNFFTGALTIATGSPFTLIGKIAAGGALVNQQNKIQNRNLKIDAGITASDNDDNMGYAAPAKTNQGVTTEQFKAFRM